MSIEASILELAAAIRYLGSQMSANPLPVAASESPAVATLDLANSGQRCDEAPEVEVQAEPTTKRGRPARPKSDVAPEPVLIPAPLPVTVPKPAPAQAAEAPEDAIKALLASLLG